MENKENQVLVSVIIPVYNVSKYLRRCLESVILQTYTNLEIILIDDGSTDNSGKLCDNYAQKDNRMVVIHKENGGLSDARNVGISNAHGSYITFVDSDDYIHASFIEQLVDIAIANRVQLVIGNYLKFVKDIDLKNQNKKFEINEKSVELFSSREAKLNMLYRKKLSLYAPGKLYEKSLFETVRFPKDKSYEDVPTLWNIVNNVDKVVYVDFVLYFYRQRKGSIVNNIYSHRKMDLVYFAMQILDEVKTDDELFKAAVSIYFFSLADIYAQVDKKHKEDRFFLEKELKKCAKFVWLDKNNSNLLRIMAKLGQTNVSIIRILGKVYKVSNKLRWRFA